MFVNKWGRHKSELRKENMRRIKEWYILHPETTQKQCADALGLARTTVNICIQQIRREEQSTK